MVRLIHYWIRLLGLVEVNVYEGKGKKSEIEKKERGINALKERIKRKREKIWMRKKDKEKGENNGRERREIITFAINDF